MVNQLDDNREFKNSPLGMIPDEWEVKKINDIAISYDAKRIPLKQSDRYKIKGNYPYYGASGIIDWINIYLFDGDYVLLGEDGENVVSRNLQLAFKVTGKFWINNHAHIYQPLPNINIDFLTIILEYTDYSSIISGSAQPKLTQKALNKLNFKIPPLAQQQQIAKILDTVDKAIAQTETLIAKYKRVKTGLMQDLLTRGIDEHGQLRDPRTHKFKRSPLGMIPDEWEVKSLSTIADVSSGVTLGRKVTGLGTIELPYLRVANVQDGYLDLSDVKTIHIYKEELLRYLLQPNDVLMNEGGDYDKLGRGTVWRGQIPLCLHQNHVFRVRPNTDYLFPDFLAFISASSYGKNFFILNSKQSTNLASINSTQLKSFPIPSPPILEQKKLSLFTKKLKF